MHHVCIFLLPKSISPEDSEKRRSNYQAYRSFLNREGPKALGSKEIPQVSLATVELLYLEVVCIIGFWLQVI